ncbi:MAG: TonB-dependent receptor [Bacteroidota bacterium]
MRKVYQILLMAAFMLLSGAVIAQGTIQGVIADADTDEPLLGATAAIEGTTMGTTAGMDGSFEFYAPAGSHNLLIRFVGYEEVNMPVTVEDGQTTDLGVITMKSSAIGLQEVNVIADVAVGRKTPVAVSTLDSKTIQENLGSQEFPEVMNYTPNVYATKTGGGYGDSRINVRGFDQRNVAVMINGIPVNDMENGWVYWSNWAGLGDATRTIQIQRGLGASKLAINSVGGTINIVTKTTDMKKGGSFEVGATSFGRFKSMISLSTGKLKSGTAITFVGSRTFGQGYIDATWVDAWSYFLSISQEINDDHQLVFTAIGAPQQHGQRDGYYMLDSNMYEQYGPKYTRNWGYRGGEMLNERVNYYHKPQMALNWYWDINDETFLATSAYVSFGTGGGSGPLGFNAYDASGKKHYTKYEPPQTEGGYYNWDLMAQYNANEEWHNIGDDGDTTFYEAGQSKHIIRNSVNNHFWTGILSTLTKDLTDDLTFTGGIDGRHYIGEHYREVRDLIGGDYWYDSRFGETKVGDKIAYWNDGIVTYSGLFAQIEYASGPLSAFFGGTVSNTWTKRKDYRTYQESGVTEEFAGNNPDISETLSNLGWNVKGGANYNIDEHHNIFINGGAYSRVPFFRFHFLNFKNDVNPDLQNEKIYSAEVGYGYTARNLKVNLNAYYSIWDDISQLAGLQAENGDWVNAFISDLKEVHTGVELDAQYNVNRWFTVGGIAAIGDWKYANDPIADLYDDATQESLGQGTLYLKDLKVHNQPQTQLGFNANFKIAKTIDFGAQYLYYDQLYARYSLEDRTNELDREQAWQLPSYGVLNARLGWAFQFAGLDSYLNINCYNALNTVAIVEAEDRANEIEGENGDITYEHTFKKGFWGWGRNFNFALKVNF